jgi:gp16 family phage-associated protein
LRTIEEVRREFKDTGVSVSEWARDRGFSVPLVYGVLSGRRPATRGQSHNIAVALGLKAGRIGSVAELEFEKGREVVTLEPEIQSQ